MNKTKMYKEIMEEPEKLELCMRENLEPMRECVRKIRENSPACIVIAARGTSCNAGKFAKYLMETRLGIPVCIAAPAVITRYEGSLNLKNSLVIGISQSGEAQDVCSLIDRGNENGALTISITNTPGSLLAQHAQHHFCCCAGKEESLAATKTFVTQLLLLTLLTALWAKDEALLGQLRLVPEIVRGVLGRAESIRALVTRWRFAEECFILARGLCYPIALEFEIKVQETSFIHSQAFSVTNFTHGPVAMITKRVPVIALACDSATDENVRDMILRVQGEGAEVAAITNKPELAKLSGEAALLLPENCEGVPGAFAAATAAQLIACELSVLRGNDPDAPRGLTKVTITK